MSLKLSIIIALTSDHGKFLKIIHFRLADPARLEPGWHFDMMCECVKHTYWRKDMLGLGGNAPRN